MKQKKNNLRRLAKNTMYFLLLLLFNNIVTFYIFNSDSVGAPFSPKNLLADLLTAILFGFVQTLLTKKDKTSGVPDRNEVSKA